ncbi:restriction endonuclease subunit S [Vibrio alginolyticus]|uniref:restriction endonuclease subunit S n=1 Tax=Vibrio alginolyticus TaxID=663 RepID=UPI001EEBF560|nr:restriction endonuclease subunit S [Vibrio alginolyticus]MCG6308481.1 restriction endonuclease subunit S [Vibrio alginolyticus]
MESLALMPKYEAYKESGVDWLGEVPDCWDLVPIRGLLNFRNEKNDPIVTEDVLSLSIANGVTQYSDEGRGGNKRKDDLTAYKIARPNDIVMNSMNVIVGAVGVSKYFGAISPVYYALYAKDDSVLISFYERIFQNEGFQRGLLRLGKGILIKFGDSGKMNTIRMKISQNDLKVLMFPKPDSETQLLISNFLDQKTAQIDEAIAIKEQQISLLKERKQIIIQQAVTQGLDPNVPMKDSGVDWIGKIPEHWEVVPLKRLAVLSPSVKVSNRKSKELVTFLAMEKVSTDGYIDQDTLMPICDVSQGFTVFNKGDVIVAKITPCFENGKSAWLNNLQTEFGYGSTEFHVLRCGQRIIGSFLYLIVSSPLFLNAGEAMMTGSAGQKRVPSSFIQNFPTAIPGVAEQEKIVSKVKELFSQIDVVVASTENQIEKLKEYKTTLINSAVTGKIKITPEMLEQ